MNPSETASRHRLCAETGQVLRHTGKKDRCRPFQKNSKKDSKKLNCQSKCNFAKVTATKEQEEQIIL
ncbi:MAG: hypothetical protein II504_09490, partial [Clostridia bacterium]|nr:hypothetical protein [Clostridia bacterium]